MPKATPSNNAVKSEEKKIAAFRKYLLSDVKKEFAEIAGEVARRECAKVIESAGALIARAIKSYDEESV